MTDSSPNSGPGADDAWLAQLREAMASADVTEPAPGPPPARRLRPPPERRGSAGSNGREAHAPTDDDPGGAVGLASLRDAVRYLGVRIATVESLAEDVARSVRRLSDAPSTVEIEQVVARVIRAELPGLLEEHLADQPVPAPVDATGALGDEALARWAERVEAGEVPSSEVVLLVHELRQRVGQLEALQRQAHEQLAADRQALIDDAVGQIRTLLFGQ